MSVNANDANEALVLWPCEHPKQRVTSRLPGLNLMADAGLAPLLTACRDAGISVISGCEDACGHGHAKALFDEREDARAFLILCYDSLAEGEFHVDIESHDDEGTAFIVVTFPTREIAAIAERVRRARGACDDAIAIHYVTHLGWLHTHGMDAHGLPELEMRLVPAYLADAAAGLLQQVCDSMLRRGTHVEAGETMEVSEVSRFRFIKPEALLGGEDHYDMERLQIVDLEPTCDGCGGSALS
jgi:hypothetical protein